jgi:hypothetical protein
MLLYTLIVASVLGTVQSAPFIAPNARYQCNPHLLDSIRGGSLQSPQTASFASLAKWMLKHVENSDIDAITDALLSLSSSQQAFKGLDGMAHEAYQRIKSTDSVDLSVGGRAVRAAARAGAAADALGACELCELIEMSINSVLYKEALNGTLSGREVVMNETLHGCLGRENMSMVVLYEEDYRGDAGIMHGGINDMTMEQKSGKPRGRLLVILGDTAAHNLERTLTILMQEPVQVRLGQGLVTHEAASVQPTLYAAAGTVLSKLEEALRTYNSSAVHIVGRSLSGGVACLASAMLEGSLSLPKQVKKKKKKSDKTTSKDETDGHDTNTTVVPLQLLGKGRTSALTLGAPPCMSSNVQADHVISIVYGDDIVCRASYQTLQRLVDRTQKSLKKSSIIGLKQVGWVSDTFSMAAANLKSHAHGSEGEEGRLALSGRAFLIRPRRLGHSCSMHEVGNQLKGGREALRAAVLWQLNDVLLSSSMWKHHRLESYIHGIDRLHLRGSDEQDE